MGDDRQQKEAADQWLKHRFLLGKVNRVRDKTFSHDGFITAYDPNSGDLQELRYPNSRVADKIHFLLDDQFKEGDLVVFEWRVAPEGKEKGNDYPIRAVKGSVRWVKEIESLQREVLDDLVVDLETLKLECIFPFAERVYIADKYARKIQQEQIPEVKSYVKQQYEEKEIKLTAREDRVKKQEDEYEQKLKTLQEKTEKLDQREARIDEEIGKCVEEKESQIKARYEEEFTQLEKRKAELNQCQIKLDKSQDEIEELGRLFSKDNEKLTRLRKDLEKREDKLKSWGLEPINTTSESDSTDFGTFDNEADLIRKIQNYIKTKGFDFNPDLIVNFYTCLKTGAIVVLAGLSGTGKTSLVRLFAEAVGAGENFELVPVKANWTDDADLRGFYHPEQKRYITTPFLDTIIKANCKPDELFFICLDEMNLSRVEYYFSDFISVLEMKKPRLTLFSERQSAENIKSPKLIIPENVFFCGTVNIDETVHSFSDKVVDRAQIIQFDQVPSFSDRTEQEDSITPVKLTFNRFKQFKELPNSLSKYPPTKWFNNLNQILKGFHFGHRVKEQIQCYCAHAMKSGLFGENPQDDIVDLQIVQKILPKIQGLTNKSLETMLKDLIMFCRDKNYSEATKKLEKLEARLRTNRSISYWELFRYVN